MRPIRARVPDGYRLVLVVSASAAIFISFIGWRTYQNLHTQQGLCEKIDRFIVLSEASVRANAELTQTEKAMRIQFFENFRNDPPVCRTTR